MLVYSITTILCSNFYTVFTDGLHTLRLHLRQQLVQHHHLSTVHCQVQVGGVRGAWLGPIKKIWVVAALPELHENVQQTHLVHFTRRVQNVDILHEDLCVPDEVGGVTFCSNQMTQSCLLKNKNKNNKLRAHSEPKMFFGNFKVVNNFSAFKYILNKSAYSYKNRCFLLKVWCDVFVSPCMKSKTNCVNAYW